MFDVDNMYNYKVEQNNIIYSIDMLRLRTNIDYSTFTEIQFRFDVAWHDKVKKYYTTGRMSEFFYNYVIEVEDGVSFWFGFLHNSEKRVTSELAKYNFTIEFNPNKLKDNKIIKYLLSFSGDWYIKSFDIAMDLKYSILDLIVDYERRKEVKSFCMGGDDLTFVSGKQDGRLKIYNKKKESSLDIDYEFTRVELSRVVDDFPIVDVNLFKYDKKRFPEIYTNNYIMKFTDEKYGDQTLRAVLFAVQNGYPVKDLSRNYKEKIKAMYEGRHKINFDSKSVEIALQQTIYFYFMKNSKVRWDKKVLRDRGYLV